MSSSTNSVESCLNELGRVIDQDDKTFENELHTILKRLTGITRERAYAPIVNIANSVLSSSGRTFDRKKMADALVLMRSMVQNVKNNCGYHNEKLEQEFFKRWLRPAPQLVHDELEPADEVSSVDFLEDDDDIEKFFVIEAKETLANIRHYIIDLESEQNWRKALANLKAAAHTLKGSSAIVGDKLISSVTHKLEEALDFSQKPKKLYIEFLVQVVDALEWLTLNMEVDDSQRRRYADQALELIDEFRVSRRVTALDTSSFDDLDGANVIPERLVGSTITLERLAFLMEEYDAARSMLVEDLRQIRGIGHSITESAQTLQDLLSQYKATQQSDNHRIREVFSDVEEYFRLFEQRMEGCQEGTDKMKELSTRLWREIVRSKRVPIGRMFGVLRKTVTELSESLGVEVELATEGGEIQVEKKVFETLFDPIVQLIRNAISHGIESRQQRQKSGKSPVGKIDVSFKTRMDDLCISIKDDGRGLDYSQLVKRASLKDFSHNLKDVVPQELMFISGLTTRESISEVAGRGIGMDVVATGINKLNGMIEVDSNPTEGTSFDIRLPSSRFYTTAYVVRALGHLFAIPNALVHRGNDDNIFFNRAKYPTVSLTRILGGGTGKRPQILVGAVEKRFYLEVDEILGEQPAVFTKLGRFFKNLPLVWGATLINEGEMAVVVNLRELFGAALHSGGEQLSLVQSSGSVGKRGKRRSVLVVDDAISVREHLKSLLQNHFFEVHLARDGREAMRLLNSHSYHLVITDLEMPGASGYELIEYVRRSTPSIDLPLMVISSKADSAERQKVSDCGVQTFLAKPFSERELLRAVKNLIG